MSDTEKVRKFWEEFRRANPQIGSDTTYQIWYFGVDEKDSAELAALVLEGKKTATASLPLEYAGKPEDAPVVGGYSVVTDFAGKPLCVVRTTEVRVVPYNEVDAEFAFDEGEGDQSLDYWREVHWDYFSKRCIAAGCQPSVEMPVNCERFELLYPKSR